MPNLKTRLNKLEADRPDCQSAYSKEQHAAEWQRAFELCEIVGGVPLAYPRRPILMTGPISYVNSGPGYALAFFDD